MSVLSLKLMNPWYQQKFQDCQKFWKRIPEGLEVVNLGSNSAFYGFDYSGLSVKAANWAMRPQSFPQDLAILKTYCSYLRHRAIILIALCPYSSCFKNYKDIELEKYYTILAPEVFENFSKDNYEVVCRIKNNPYWYAKKQMLLTGPKMLIGRLLRSHIPLELLDKQLLNEAQLEVDAKCWIDGWKEQFKIEDMDAPQPEHIVEGRKKRVAVLKEMIDFCKGHDFQPVIVLPPVTDYLSLKFSETFRHNYIYSFLKESEVLDTPFLNYLDDKQFKAPSLYFNSFFLNRRGARLFTEVVLKDIRLRKFRINLNF
ncbi:hypothetical protein [uncultured Bacteroides sp.]|uniref:hypothetical protein n=1 Tax=uncultured Bacteroides sp. TaxID=162156 RepID=UPI002623A9D8|nr:hypothetical protein [uncultured Bacteroides sp.]